MKVSTQFTGSVPAGGTKTWFTHSWDPASHVLWTVVPVSPAPGAPQVEWTVKVQRASETSLTYYVTVRNLTAAAVDVEGRYAVVS